MALQGVNQINGQRGGGRRRHEAETRRSVLLVTRLFFSSSSSFGRSGVGKLGSLSAPLLRCQLCAERERERKERKEEVWAKSTLNGHNQQ